MTSTVRRYVANVATDSSFYLAEGPRWVADSDELLWVDIDDGRLMRGQLSRTGTIDGSEWLRLDRPVGAVAPTNDGGLVLAAGAGFLLVKADRSLEEVAQPAADVKPRVRMNDGACDPQGRFWAGTVALDETAHAGSLYRLDPDGTAHVVLSGISISNGLDWSLDGLTMYYADSATGRIDAFDFDPSLGAISARRTFTEVEGPGVPDGLTVDTEGRVWTAIWGVGEVRCFDPSGAVDAVVDVPAPHTSACCFAGPGLDTLVITTAREGLDDQALEAFPLSGRLFTSRVDAVGRAARPYSRR